MNESVSRPMWNHPATVCNVCFGLLLLTGLGVLQFGVYGTPMWPDALSVAFTIPDGQWGNRNRNDVTAGMSIVAMVAQRFFVAAGVTTIAISVIGLSASWQLRKKP